MVLACMVQGQVAGAGCGVQGVGCTTVTKGYGELFPSSGAAPRGRV
jgi:hypothetical protein